MTEKRTPRDGEQRDSDVRPSDSWIPASVIPDPEPQDGWVFRWVRTSILGQTDATHTSRMFREGWEPVRAEDHPELMLTSDVGSKFEGNIEVGGLLLCKTSIENVRGRQEYYAELSKRQTESVDQNFMRDSDPRMPKINESRTQVSFGGGAKPK